MHLHVTKAEKIRALPIEVLGLWETVGSTGNPLNEGEKSISSLFAGPNGS